MCYTRSPEHIFHINYARYRIVVWNQTTCATELYFSNKGLLTDVWIWDGEYTGLFKSSFETWKLVSEFHFCLSRNFFAEHCSSKHDILHLNCQVLVNCHVGRPFMFLVCSNSYLDTGWIIDYIRTRCNINTEQPATRYIEHILAAEAILTALLSNAFLSWDL